MSVKIARRFMKRKGHRTYMMVDEPQDLNLQEQQRRTRVLRKLICIMGLSRHPLRIYRAQRMITWCNSCPDWALKYTDSNYGQLALDLPKDIILDERFFTGESCEYHICNSAATFIWINENWPQGSNAIRCMCGKMDDECNEQCEGCRKPIKSPHKIHTKQPGLR
jgi:hypothetical protein